ncbi:MAG: hypothetical protein ABR574_13670, partial [Cryomorphaceae bacterium]
AVIMEYPYVDKVYRNSYYQYYASKNNGAYRDCIRLSFLKKEISAETLRGKDAAVTLQEVYLGYMIVRPTPTSIVGRSAISPLAKGNDLSICLAPMTSTMAGVKLGVNAFPHSSQDSETLSCAETTIWSLMEYYSTKYPDYRPVLPADIIEVLAASTSERQLPSAGLSIPQIAFALKKFGFGPRIYTAAADPENFQAIVSTYIESGIPLIAALSSKDNSIRHANLIVGRKIFTTEHLEKLESTNVSDLEIDNELREKDFKYFDFHQIRRSYIFNDDNCPTYQLAEFDHPCKHYGIPVWASCQIFSIATPLYHKMYLEAAVSRRYIELFLFKVMQVQNNRSSILTRLFMASSRSYKHYLAVHSEMDSGLRNALLDLEMAKFIWVCELSTKELLGKHQADGFVIIDATEINYQSQECLMAAYCDGQLIIKPDKHNLENFKLTLSPFSIYEENLKSA